MWYLQEMANWLPEGWEITKKGKKEHYTNKVTGQAFDTKEAMERYVNYVTNIEPHLEDFKKCYMDEASLQFIDRPWEEEDNEGKLHHDKLHDYIVGNIGKVRDLKESGSSSGPTAEAMPTPHPEAPKEKVPTGSVGQSSGTKHRKNKRPRKKQK